MYIIKLPQEKTIAVPKNLKFLAIPFYELYENAQAFGPQLAALPHYLARYRFEYVNENGEVVAHTPGGPIESGARTERKDPRYFHEDTTMNGASTTANGNVQQNDQGHNDVAGDGDTDMPE